MYTSALIALLVLAGLLIYKGFLAKKKVMLAGGILLAVSTPLFFWLMGFWAEMLWFRELGYEHRFWTLWLTQGGLFIGGMFLTGLLTFVLTMRINKSASSIRITATVIAALVGAFLWARNWEVFLKFFDRVPTDLTDPVLKQTTGFYLFVYPFLRLICSTLLYAGIIALGANFTVVIQPMQIENGVYRFNINKSLRDSIFTGTGFTLIILGLGKYLDRFRLLFSKHGVVFGPGWTDVHVRLPLFTFVSAITILAGIIMLIPSIRVRFPGRIIKKDSYQGFLPWLILAGGVLAIWIIFLSLIPTAFQSLKVIPNELSLEKTYLKNNIEFTRQGFGLDRIGLKEFSVSQPFSREEIGRAHV